MSDRKAHSAPSLTGLASLSELRTLSLKKVSCAGSLTLCDGNSRCVGFVILHAPMLCTGGAGGASGVWDVFTASPEVFGAA